jgi:hypothetical protein
MRFLLSVVFSVGHEKSETREGEIQYSLPALLVWYNRIKWWSCPHSFADGGVSLILLRISLKMLRKGLK